MKKSRFLALVLSLSLLLLPGCRHTAEALPEPDPHAGMVLVEDASGSRWIRLYENLPAANFDQNLFKPDGEYINYTDSNTETLRGIDVSFYQGEIDWAAVKADGVDFAMIRAGYRGYTEGRLFEDELCRQNIQGALANGIRVGLYVFSQAIDTAEAQEEAALLLSIAGDYTITMPLAFDWEHVGSSGEARTDGLAYETITDCAAAFCQAVQEAGFTPMVYFYESLGYDVYDLGRLADYDFWLADIGSSPEFYYAFSMWQYTDSAAVSGISGAVDLNLCFKTYDLEGDSPDVPAS